MRDAAADLAAIRDAGCTCPPLVDVMRGRAADTRPECPLHPTPNFPSGTFLPAIRLTGPDVIFSAPEPSSTAAAAHDEERLDGEPRS